MPRRAFISKEDLFSIMENTKEKRKIHFIKFLESYRKRVNEYYKNEFSESPGPFKFMSFLSINSIYTNDRIYDVITLSNTNKDEFNNMCIYFEQDELSKINALPAHLKEKELLNKIEKTDYIDILEDSLNSPYYNDGAEKAYEMKAIDAGCHKADMHYNRCDAINALNALKISHKDLSNFNPLDLNSITSKVNNLEFEYELEESAKAYNAELYLASAMTAEIAIETLLRVIIIKKLGKFKLPRESYMLTSGLLLLKSGIIDQKLFNRIESINKLRHGLAHSSTGKADQWDCEQIFGFIKLIVDTLL